MERKVDYEINGSYSIWESRMGFGIDFDDRRKCSFRDVTICKKSHNNLTLKISKHRKNKPNQSAVYGAIKVAQSPSSRLILSSLPAEHLPILQVLPFLEVGALNSFAISNDLLYQLCCMLPSVAYCIDKIASIPT